MTEANFTKAAKPATMVPLFELPKFELPKFDMPKMEVPEAMREFAEKGLAQAKDAYEKIKAAADDATRMLEDTNSTLTKAAAEYNRKALAAGRTNVNAAFDWALALAKVTSLNEMLEVSAAHMRGQVEALTEQSKELAALAQKAATETAEPIKNGLSQAFKKVA
jgi:phasin